MFVLQATGELLSYFVLFCFLKVLLALIIENYTLRYVLVTLSCLQTVINYAPRVVGYAPKEYL
jgi:hypothetical protein